MPFATFGNDIFAIHGCELLSSLLEKQPAIPPTDSIPRFRSLSARPSARSTGLSASSQSALPAEPVGILGAGASGLYAALILDDKFPNSTGAPFNYFDVGAMRFPDIPAMRRVFHLFRYSPLNTSGIDLEAKLKPYYFRGAANNDTLMSHNGVTVKQNAIPAGDPFQSAAVILDTDPQPYLRAGAKAIADDVIEPFAIDLLKDFDNGTNTGWENPTRHFLPTSSTGWRRLTSLRAGTIAPCRRLSWRPSRSDGPRLRTQWRPHAGGALSAFQIADCMAKYIRSRKRDAIVLNRRVTGIGLANDQTAIEVVTDGVDRQRFPMQSGALRQLNYGPSIKIGMQFRTAWWTTGLDKDGRPLNIIGGQSYTDTPLKTVVYPSFGDVKAGKTTTLIASYCWTEDAERLGTLIGNGDQILVELVLRELASIHNVTVDFLQGQLIDTFAWNWSRDPYTMGAFAFFGPGKFANVFNSLNTPAASGRLHSAWRSVFELVTLDEAFSDYRERFFQNWGVNAEFFERGSKALPRDAQPIFATMPSESRRSKRSTDLPTERVDLGNLLQGSLLMKAIAVTHPELVDK